MSGSQGGLPQHVTVPVVNANPQIDALLRRVVQGAHNVQRIPRRVQNAATPIVQGVGSKLDEGWTDIKEAARSAKQQLDRLAQTAQRTLDEQKEFASAAGERFFDPTAIALELSGIAGGLSSQFAPPANSPYFSVLPGSAFAVEAQALVTSEPSGLNGIDGKPNPVLVAYYATHQKNAATLRQGNTSVSKYFKTRHRKSMFGAGAGFVAVVTGLIRDGHVGPFVNAGIHGIPLASTTIHLGKFIQMRNREGLDARLKPWLDLIIEIKTVKSLIRTNLYFLSIPFTEHSVWYQLIGASATRLTYRPRILGACCIAAADLHARAHIEQGFAAGAPAAGNNQPVPASANAGNRANSLPAPRTGVTASRPATDIIVELFSKFGMAEAGDTDAIEIIKAPAGWLAIANKMMLL